MYPHHRALRPLTLLLSLLLLPLLLGNSGAEATPAQSEGDGYRIEAEVVPGAVPDDEATVRVILTNTGDRALWLRRSSPCDPPFAVRIVSGAGEELYHNGRSGYCVAIPGRFSLAPGGRHVLDLSVTLRPGSYILLVSLGLNDWERPRVTHELPLVVGDSRQAVPPEQSASGASRPPHWADPYLAQALLDGLITLQSPAWSNPDGTPTLLEFKQFLLSAGGLPEIVRTGESDAGVRVSRTEAVIWSLQAFGFGSGCHPEWGVPDFRDGTEEWSRGCITAAQALGIIQGGGQGTARLREWTRYGEAVAIILRAKEAIRFTVRPEAGVWVGDRRLAGAELAVLSRVRPSPIALVPLSPVAVAFGIAVTEDGGAYFLRREGRSLELRAGRSFGLCQPQPMPFCHEDPDGNYASHFGTPPVILDGQLYVPFGALQALGLQVRYEREEERVLLH